MTNKPLNSVLVKPAGPDCNLSCDYCFYTPKSSLFGPRPRMSEDTLEIFSRQALQQSSGSMSLGWQGGEPTLMGLDFFKKAVELQARYGAGQEITNGIQTNGVLIDEAWARWFSAEGWLVGLSIDGPAHIHDRYRRTGAGHGTYGHVRDSAKRLLDAGAPVNALSVISDYAAEHAEEIYRHHKELGIYHMQFIPLLEPDPEDPQKPASFSVPPDGLAAFWREMFDLWWNDFKNGAPTTSVRLFDDLFYAYAGLSPPDCSLLQECGVYVVIEHNGDVYSCDFFVEPAWKLGNIHQSGIKELLNSGRQKEFGRRKSRLAGECQSCEWLYYCRGGCPRERGYGGDKKNYFCQAFEELFRHSHSRMEALAEEWKEKQTAINNNLPPKDKPGRNDPCPCGSGRKYKKCCGR
ncbi:MAG: anaerobic sulfatase maturase [bacterium]